MMSDMGELGSPTFDHISSLRRFLVFWCGVLMSILGTLFGQSTAVADGRSAYDFSFAELRGGAPLPLTQFSGKVLLVVNTASKCGFTGQYEGLEKLYETYREQGLVVIGVPSNDFGHQEPGSAEEIASFCKLNYGVTFPVTAKEVVSGDTAHPFYRWAKETLGFGTAPKWNFHKYLINRDGKLVDYFHSTTTPASSRLIEAIEKLLSEPAVGKPSSEKAAEAVPE
jgi:glutathione peroxidase